MPPRSVALALAALVALAGPAGARQGPAPEGLDFAHRLLADKRYELAAEEYETFLRTDPAGRAAADARFGLATARLFSNQYAEARREFERFLADYPDHPNAPAARFRAGETAYQLGDLPAARQALETYTTRHRGHRYQETAWTYLGDVCYRLGDFAAARAAYEHALEEFPEGRLVDRSRYGLARARAALKDYDGAIAPLAAILAGKGGEWRDRARYQMGLVQAEAGRPAEALAALEALERESPKSPLLPEARLRRAEALAKLDRFDESDAILEPLAAGDGPLAPRAAYALASARLRWSRPEEALRACDDALGRFADTPLAPLLLFRSAEAMAKLNRRDDARRRYLKVAEDFPKDDWADVALVRAAEQALRGGDHAAARELARRLDAAFPASVQKANAHLIEAQAALAGGDAEAAVKRLEALLADDRPDKPTEQAARLALGVAYRAAGQPEKAAEALRDLGEAPADAQYVLGAGHFEAKRYAEAVPPLEAYLAAKPDGDVAPDALALLAIAQAELGHDAEADAAVERLAKDFPQHRALTRARLRLGEAALEAKDHGRTIELLRPVAEGAKDPVVRGRALWGLGWALLESDRATDAAAAFAELIELAPEGPLAADAALAQARALDAAGRTDEALAAYDRIIGGDPQGGRAAAATLAKARLLDRTGRPGEAADLFGRYLTDHPGPAAEGDEPTDAVLADWGWALLDADRREEAVAAFDRLLNGHPQSPRGDDARVVLAESAHAAGELDRAEELLAPLVAEGSQADPALRQSALFRLGLVRLDRKDWPGAIERFDRLASEFPDGELRPKARFWSAEASFQAGDARTAEAAFAALLDEPAPAGSEEWRATARLRHVESLVALGRWADALEAADALKADPAGVPAAHELEYARGRALQGLGRFDEARTAYQAVIDARRADDFAARAQLMRGETFFHQDRLNEALREFLKVVYNYDAPPHQAAALLEAGKVAEKLQRWKDAADFYAKLAADFPDDPNAATASARLAAVKGRLGGEGVRR